MARVMSNEISSKVLTTKIVSCEKKSFLFFEYYKQVTEDSLYDDLVIELNKPIRNLIIRNKDNVTGEIKTEGFKNL